MQATHGAGGDGLQGFTGAQPHLSSWKPRRRSLQRTWPAVLVMMASTLSTLHSNFGSPRASSTCDATNFDTDPQIEKALELAPLLWRVNTAAALGKLHS